MNCDLVSREVLAVWYVYIICQYRDTRELTESALCSVLLTPSQPSLQTLRKFSYVTNTAGQKFEYILINNDCQGEFVKTFSDGTIWKFKKASSLATINRVFHQGTNSCTAKKECEYCTYSTTKTQFVK